MHFWGMKPGFACNLVDSEDHRIRWRKAYHRTVEVSSASSASAAGDTLGVFLETFDPRLLETIISSDPSIFPEEHKQQFTQVFFSTNSFLLIILHLRHFETPYLGKSLKIGLVF